MVSSRGLKSGVLVPISISLIRLWYRRTEFLKTFSFNSSSLKMVLSNGEKKMWIFHTDFVFVTKTCVAFWVYHSVHYCFKFAEPQ